MSGRACPYSLASLSLSVVLGVLWAGVAHAEPTPAQKAEADALFIDGRRLMAERQFAEACRKLEASQKLDPAGGTLLNLAVCHEEEGKLATAWVEFSDALVQAKIDKKDERIALAREHIADLQRRLPKLNITLDRGIKIEGLRVQRDDQPVLDALFGTSVPVDPGTHTITASAPGRVTWTMVMRLAPGESKTVEIPELQLAAPGADAATGSALMSQEALAQRRTLALVVGGAGVLALGVGSYFGIETLSKKSQSDEHCPTATTCSPRGVELNDQAHSAAWGANIGIGAGLIGVGVGTYLFLTSTPERGAPSTAKANTRPRISLTPIAERSRMGFSLSGGF